MTAHLARPIHDGLFNYFCEFDAEALIDSFHLHGQAPEPGLIRNFLGTRIPPSVFPQVLDNLAGTLEGRPWPGNWHADIAEWAAGLRTVERAQAAGQKSYRVVELGCGWGCWITNMGVAARSRGLDVDLIGIEGDVYHLQSARDVLQMNGFHPDQFALHHGVAGPKQGKAIFPVHAVDGSNWGAEPIFYPAEQILQAAETDPRVQVLDCFTLDQLSQSQPIDLLHIDIQGAEYDYVQGNAQAMASHVRRVLIGTHSRILEGQLCAHFLSLGWRMEMERTAIAPLVNGRPEIRIDGVQLWANPGLV